MAIDDLGYLVLIAQDTAKLEDVSAKLSEIDDHLHYISTKLWEGFCPCLAEDTVHVDSTEVENE